MRLAIVVPALNEEVHIEQTVRSASTEGGPCPAVFVVDGGSHDDTILRAKSAGAQVGSSSQDSFAYAHARHHLHMLVHALMLMYMYLCVHA